MRVLYSGGTICSFKTLQRLILLADEIGFMDRPSVIVGNFGTIGRDSEFREFRLENSPIAFSVHAQPEGRSDVLYLRYIEADLRDVNFIRIVLDGLKADVTFQGRLLQLEANYGWGSGQQVLDELLKDAGLYAGDYGETTETTLLYVPDTATGRRQTLRVLLIEASIQVTNALITAESTQLIPVSDDPFFCQLIALRSSEANYVFQPAHRASLFGLAIMKSTLPDEVLSRLTIGDLFNYRASAKDAYALWSLEVEQLAQKLLDIPANRVAAEAAKLVVTDVRPRMLELRLEMASARDKLFGDLIKTVGKWELPTISLAYLASLNLPSAMAAFAGALVPTVPALVDYFLQRRNLVRRNSMAYLVGVSKILDDER